MIKQESGKWHLYSADGSKHLGGPYDTKDEAVKREAQVEHFKHAKAEVSMLITKASMQTDGSIRWQAVTSDTSPDSYTQSTTIQLFQDWIERANTGVTVDWLPPPRKPFLGVSHYPSLDGEGEAGITTEMWVQGNRFKAGGTFNPTPLGNALFSAIRSEIDLTQKGQLIDKPIRISAAWWDIQHSHGSFVFTRRSLTDVCPMCEAGEIANIKYLLGQADHWASTRVPVHPGTSLSLQEKSMAITRLEDAASIIDEEIAEGLEAKSQPVTKSAALVSKAKPKPEITDNAGADEKEQLDEAETETTDEVKGKDRKGKVPPQFAKKADLYKFISDNKPSRLGGALTLADGYDYLQANKSSVVVSRADLMGLVKRNISDLPAAERLEALESLMDEFHTELNEVKNAVEEVYLLQPAIEIEQETPTMDYLDKFTTDVETALTSKEPLEQRAASVQKALNEVSLQLKAALTTPTDPTNQAEIIAIAVQRAMTPFVDQLAQLSARQVPTHQPVIQVPVQRSIQAPVLNQQAPQQQQLPVSPITGQPSSITAVVRGGMGLY